jgi:plasmid stability protein
MSITICLPPEAEEKLRRRAVEAGVAPDALARQILEQALNGGEPAESSGRCGAALDEMLAPVREEFERSGMTEEELTQFLTEVRDEVRREKRAGKVP